LVDCLRQRGEFETALSLIQATDLFGINSKHSGKNWHYSLKARILYALSRHEEAMGVADTALSQTSDEDVNSQTAYLYEIKARVSLELNRPDKERHLAHAIALHLAFGETRLARELSEYFKPKFTPIAEDQITSQTMDSIELIDNATPASTSGL
jgi:tetratricopeptide (TPR) repeat protein